MTPDTTLQRFINFLRLLEAIGYKRVPVTALPAKPYVLTGYRQPDDV